MTPLPRCKHNQFNFLMFKTCSFPHACCPGYVHTRLPSVKVQWLFRHTNGGHLHPQQQAVVGAMEGKNCRAHRASNLLKIGQRALQPKRKVIRGRDSWLGVLKPVVSKALWGNCILFILMHYVVIGGSRNEIMPSSPLGSNLICCTPRRASSW